MYRPRVIPVLLLKQNALIKSKKFSNYKYIGDPINAVKILNDLKADELVFLDIFATKENRLIPIKFVEEVGEEANMPFAVGGGIKTLDDIRLILNAGAEKVIINSYAVKNPEFIKKASDTFGSSAIVVCLDVKKNLFLKPKIWIKNGKKSVNYSPLEFAKLMEKMGAGEIIIQSIERDGMMNGYDIDLIRTISELVAIPTTALGGAGNLHHMKELQEQSYINGLAAGSMFVFYGSHHSVLINYPDKKDIILNFAWKNNDSYEK